MLRKELYTLRNGIKNCNGLSHPNSHEFAYRIVCIADDVDSAIEKIEKSRPKPSPEFIKFIEEQNTALDECAQKNDDGSFVTINQQSNIENEHQDLVSLKNPSRYKELMDELKVKYQKAIDDYDKANKKFEEFLSKEATDFKFEPILKKYLPPSISVAQLKGIKTIIEK